MPTYDCPMRWGDMDAQGHLNNGAYIDYLQEARVKFLMTGPEALRPMLAEGVLIVGHQVEYLAPVVFSERSLRVDLWVEHVGGSRFGVGYKVFDGPVLSARARTELAAFDLASSTLRRLKATQREALRAATRPAEPLRELPGVAAGPGGSKHCFEVRWSDLDAYGHVNNVRFYDYLQEARVAVLREVLGWAPVDVWLLARQDVRYRRPLDFRLAPYEVRTRVIHVGHRSFTLAAEIGDPQTDDLYAYATTVVVSQLPLTEERRTALARLA